MRVLIFGLSGAGKTTLAEKLQPVLAAKGIEFTRINGDEMRKRYNDWDFSTEGRLRQADRISVEADLYPLTLIDFIAPLQEQRDIVDADYVIWMDTVKSSQYYDTDKVFDQPTIGACDDTIHDIHYDVDVIANHIIEYYKEYTKSRGAIQ